MSEIDFPFENLYLIFSDCDISYEVSHVEPKRNRYFLFDIFPSLVYIEPFETVCDYMYGTFLVIHGHFV